MNSTRTISVPDFKVPVPRVGDEADMAKAMDRHADRIKRAAEDVRVLTGKDMDRPFRVECVFEGTHGGIQIHLVR